MNKLKKIIRDTLKTFKLIIFRKPLILIYQMGKVGSQSIEYSLNQKRKFNIHFHYMSHLKEQKYWLFLIVNVFIKFRLPILVISPIREPISRNISSFAHDFDGFFGGKMQDFSLEELSKLFFNNWDRHQNHSLFFDEEFKKHMKIDVYKTRFDKKQKWSHYQNKNIKSLIFDISLPNKKIEKLIEDFCSIPDFELLIKNKASSKANYKGNYKEFSAFILNNLNGYDVQMKKSKYYEHFFLDKT